MPKLDRKELKKPDGFVSRGRLFLSYLSEKRKRFIPVAVAGAVLIAVVYGVDWWTYRNLEQSWLQYNTAMKLEGEQKWDALKKLMSERSLSRPTCFASLALADHFYEESKKRILSPVSDTAEEGETNQASDVQTLSSEAVAWYSKALGFSDLLPSERQLIYINRGNAYEIQGKFDESLKDYQMASDFGEEAKGLAMLSLGRVFELKGDTTKAEETYKTIINNFSKAEYSKMAKNSLRRLKSPLFSNSKL